MRGKSAKRSSTTGLGERRQGGRRCVRGGGKMRERESKRELLISIALSLALFPMTSFARSREPSLSLRARACTGALAVATRESRGTACCLPRGHRGGEGRLHGWSGGGAKGQKKELKSSCGESRDEASSWVFPLALPLFFFSCWHLSPPFFFLPPPPLSGARTIFSEKKKKGQERSNLLSVLLLPSVSLVPTR